MTIPVEARLAQSDDAINRLQGELRDWFDCLAKKDSLRKFRMQIADLKTMLHDEAISRLRTAWKALPIGAPYGEASGQCRRVEKGIAHVRKVALYFRAMYDQRDKPEWKPLLDAADEVAWSCYHLPFRMLGRTVSSPPLPHVAPVEAPTTVPRIEPPAEFKTDDEALKGWLQELPIPVVSLPPSCVREPWRLILLGHEMGHHVLLDLAPNWELRSRVKELLCDAVGDESPRWGTWADEIFADLWGFLTVGPWSLWALADVVAADAKGMLKATRSAGSYPPPVVRLALLIHLAKLLGVPCGERVLRDYGLDLKRIVTEVPASETAGERKDREQAGLEFAQVETVARRLLEWELDLGDAKKVLKALARWDDAQQDFQPSGAVETWAQGWKEGAPQSSSREPSAVRLMTASAVEAWANAVTDEQDPNAASCVQDNLRRHFSETILAVREGTDRASKVKIAGLGASLVELALSEGPESS